METNKIQEKLNAEQTKAILEHIDAICKISGAGSIISIMNGMEESMADTLKRVGEENNIPVKDVDAVKAAMPQVVANTISDLCSATLNKLKPYAENPDTLYKEMQAYMKTGKEKSNDSK